MIDIKSAHFHYAIIFDILSLSTTCFNESVHTSLWLRMASYAQNVLGVRLFFRCTERCKRSKLSCQNSYYNSKRRFIVIY